ncbi:other/RAN protein kinase [Ephemerocybe angulata]|uniref:Other/RAN protein kinase n=1 Tax=Ephemerocybe angulata TaxID=980116 RepID=A0A8H6HE54_9AGAR|nr:other/RAN protein kinase [Tulosesus angulatus]
MSKLAPPSAHPPLGTLIHDNTIQLVEVIGSGGYGVVFKAIDVSSKRHRSYAVKCMSKAKNRRTSHVRELNFHLQATGHPGVVDIYGAVEDDKFTYFVMEYATSNDLFHQILQESRYLGQDNVIREVFLQLIDGVQRCHDAGVFHRDLKPENVMCFDEGFRVAITDFGLATSDTSSCEFRTGSIYHMSPECQSGHFREDAYSPQANDVWSLGVILLNMVTGRNPWKAATSEDPVYQNYLKSPFNFFSTVLPVSRPLNNLLVMVLNPDWNARATLDTFRELVEKMPTFYSVNVHFEGNLARYCWEAGIKARTDMVDGVNGPLVKRPVPPIPSFSPVAKKPVSPIHEEARARPFEVTPAHVHGRQQGSPAHTQHRAAHPAPKARIIHRGTVPPHHVPSGDPPSPHLSMESIAPDEARPVRISSMQASHTPSSRGNSSPSSSFPKTPASSPHRVTIVKRRPRVPSDILVSPSYSPQLDDPMEFYGSQFCKRLAAIPSDADSDATDDTMQSPTSSLSWTNSSAEQSARSRSRSTSSRTPSSDVIRYPEIVNHHGPSKPIDIVGGGRHRQRPPRHPAMAPFSSHHPQPQYCPHPASPHLNRGFRHRKPPTVDLSRQPSPGRVTKLRNVYEARPVSPRTAYASGNAHWYH